MLDYSYLLSIAIILLSTKVLGGLTEKIKLPSVVGAILAGILIGPAMLNIVADTQFLDEIAQLGVIILMFMAGLDTDLDQLKKQGPSYCLIALFGVFIPLIGGTLTYVLFFHVGLGDTSEILKAVFIGVILTATSVSITVEALRELGHLTGKIGNAILGAAVVDDVMGIIILTIITSFKDTSVSVSGVMIKILMYFLGMLILGVAAVYMAKFLDTQGKKRRLTISVFAWVLIISYLSEVYVGIADITGAYLTGMIFSQFGIRKYIAKKMNVLSYLFFSPIFFASIGLKTKFDTFTNEMLIFSAILLLVAILTKVIGCGVGAKICKYTNHEALNIGIGMVSRGEVALIVANKGHALGLIDHEMFSPVVLMVVATTILTPVLLKKTLSENTKSDDLSLKDLPVPEEMTR